MLPIFDYIDFNKNIDLNLDLTLGFQITLNLYWNVAVRKELVYWQQKFTM